MLTRNGKPQQPTTQVSFEDFFDATIGFLKASLSLIHSVDPGAADIVAQQVDKLMRNTDDVNIPIKLVQFLIDAVDLVLSTLEEE